MTSTTPRTDAMVQTITGYADTFAPRYKVEELERELNAANTMLERTRQVLEMVPALQKEGDIWSCHPNNMKNFKKAAAQLLEDLNTASAP